MGLEFRVEEKMLDIRYWILENKREKMMLDIGFWILDIGCWIMGMGYKDLEIYQLSHKLTIEIHKMIMDKPGRKIYNFIKGVESEHTPTSNIKHLTSEEREGK